jgi:hypothetical protein
MVTAGILAFICRWVIGINMTDPEEDDEVNDSGYMGNGLEAYNHWVNRD